jgi:hypothetical protein
VSFFPPRVSETPCESGAAHTPHGRAPRATARTGGAVSNSKPGARPPADTADR